MTQNHISIDCETMGTANDALLLSIGAVAFDPLSGQVLEEFHAIIDQDGAHAVGSIDASTVFWWMRQGEAARDALFANDLERVTLRAALDGLAAMVSRYPGAVVWQRGNKDSEWIASACQSQSMRCPWRYWQVRDQRTLAKLFEHVPFEQIGGEVKHNALADAKNQAAHVSAIFQHLQRCGALAVGQA